MLKLPHTAGRDTSTATLEDNLEGAIKILSVHTLWLKYYFSPSVLLKLTHVQEDRPRNCIILCHTPKQSPKQKHWQPSKCPTAGND